MPYKVSEEARISRRELLGRLAREGYLITERQLHYWEEPGQALPPAPMQLHEGQAQSVYPWWYTEVVKQVAIAVRRRGGRRRVPKELRAEIRRRILKVAEAVRAGGLFWTVYGEPDYPDEEQQGEWPLLPQSVAKGVREFARKIEEESSGSIPVAETTFYFSDGRTLTYRTILGAPFDKMRLPPLES